MGKIKTCDQFQMYYEVDGVQYADEMDLFFSDAVKSNLNADSKPLLVLSGHNSDSGMRHVPPNVADVLPKTFQLIDKDKGIDSSILYETMSRLRMYKTDLELQVMRYASLISSRAHVAVMQACKPGMMEYQLEAEFLRFCYYYGGCRHVAYTCICAAFSNAAVLHYGHAGAPNDCALEADQMALLDMGGEYHCYASDITCSYPISGKFTDFQREVYQAVRNAQLSVFQNLRPGSDWTRMHELAEIEILSFLLKEQILRGTIEQLMESRVGALFMPHGLGHLIGLDTHDVGGYLSEAPARSTKPGLRSLRTARLLEAGMIVTVEPGLYFVEALLDPSLPLGEEYQNMREFINPEALQKHNLVRKGWGVRLEDVVLITSTGYELLSCVPREIEDVERVMTGAKFEPLEAQWNSFLNTHVRRKIITNGNAISSINQ
uniref:Peptidase M24 domain-containing protein n=1 Tax=Timspurckia oligopyrenoides TaxID=708627 RepID=A0A7S1EU27_9RHOD|mmetsp:Transcript_7770/g.14106  ORF Transcript_7770/g.14106 Transcript_7770/m.14106 type:complete len:433 (+) Transcript_7770:342-1640(+)